MLRSVGYVCVIAALLLCMTGLGVYYVARGAQEGARRVAAAEAVHTAGLAAIKYWKCHGSFPDSVQDLYDALLIRAKKDSASVVLNGDISASCDARFLASVGFRNPSKWETWRRVDGVICDEAGAPVKPIVTMAKGVYSPAARHSEQRILAMLFEVAHGRTCGNKFIDRWLNEPIRAATTEDSGYGNRGGG